MQYTNPPWVQLILVLNMSLRSDIMASIEHESKIWYYG